jgi:hypothetical protein
VITSAKTVCNGCSTPGPTTALGVHGAPDPASTWVRRRLAELRSSRAIAKRLPRREMMLVEHHCPISGAHACTGVPAN